jgi:hypothetical protein
MPFVNPLPASPEVMELLSKQNGEINEYQGEPQGTDGHPYFLWVSEAVASSIDRLRRISD